MNLFSEVRRFFSRRPDNGEITTRASKTAAPTPTGTKPLDAASVPVESDLDDDQELTVPELPIFTEDIQIAEDPVGFDPYDSVGKPGVSG